MTTSAGRRASVSVLPDAVDPDAFFAFVMRLADLARDTAGIVVSLDSDLSELREDVAELGTRVGLESELRAGADETLRNEVLELDRRVTLVHGKALRALTARYAPKEPA